jgi:hypothetical protein
MDCIIPAGYDSCRSRFSPTGGFKASVGATPRQRADHFGVSRRTISRLTSLEIHKRDLDRRDVGSSTLPDT